MKVAVIQFNAGPDKRKNVKRAVGHVQKAIAKKAQFILLPEVFSYRGKALKPKDLSSVAESIPGESTKPFIDLAKKHKVFILAGSVFEKIKGTKKVYNTSVLIDDKGRVRAKYRKINLFKASIGNKKVNESKFFKPGTTLQKVRIKNFCLGLTICYDLRFPELYKKYSRLGVNVFCIPSAFTQKTGKAHWRTLTRARAIENLSYVLAPNQFGKNARGIDHYGHSLIINPWGAILAEAKMKKEKILYATLKQSEIHKAKSLLPSIRK